MNDTAIADANNSAVEMTNIGYNSRHDSVSVLNITEEPVLGAIAINNTKISNSRNISQNKKQKREKMTEAELDWLTH